MNIKQYALRTGIAWLALIGFMILLAPDGLPVVLLIVPFVLLFVALYTTWNLCGMLRRPDTTGGTSHKRLGMALCGTVVLLLVLQSLGQLTLRDIITVAIIVAVGYLYLRRNWSKVSK